MQRHSRVAKLEAATALQRQKQDAPVTITDFSALRARLEALKPWYREKYLADAERKALPIPEQDELARVRVVIEHYLKAEERERLSFADQSRLAKERQTASLKWLEDLKKKNASKKTKTSPANANASTNRLTK